MILKMLLATVVLALAIPTAASAQTDREALWRGVTVAYQDCGPKPTETWTCHIFPASWSIERRGDRYYVEVWYVRRDFITNQTGRCVTNTHWAVSGVAMTYHTKGCSGVVNP